MPEIQLIPPPYAPVKTTVAGSRGGAAIAAPTAPGTVYAQAEAASAVTAINALRTANADQAALLGAIMTALANAGIVVNNTTT